MMTYIALVLDGDSVGRLLDVCLPLIEEGGWDIYCHHVTMSYPTSPDQRRFIGETMSVTVTDIGVLLSEEAAVVRAVKVDPIHCPVENPTPHVTMAVKIKSGFNPVDSNRIDNWEKCDPVILTGTVQEIEC